MSISVTTILGTDSLSGSRIVINDNFKVLADEINEIENYLDPDAGTLANLNGTTTATLLVGSQANPYMQITASVFNILRNVRSTGNITLEGGGLFRNDFDPQTLDDSFAGGSVISLGTSSAPPSYTGYRVGNSDTSAVEVQVYEGAIGQELFFVYSESSTGAVTISSADSTFAIDNQSTSAAGSTITLTEKGQTVHMLAVETVDSSGTGTGNTEWYIVGGSGYTVA